MLKTTQAAEAIGEMMQAHEVLDYLKGNLDFFETYAEDLAALYVPHPHGGHAIPISERLIFSLREKNQVLEAKFIELLQFGEENDALSEKVHRLSVELLSALDIASIISVAERHLRDDFSVPHTALRVWGLPGAPAEFLPESIIPTPDTLTLAEQLQNPFCGTHIHEDVRGWFGETAEHLKSFALVRLGKEHPFGLLVLASEDAERFYADMGTLYLNRIGELLSAAIHRTAG